MLGLPPSLPGPLSLILLWNGGAEGIARTKHGVQADNASTTRALSSSGFAHGFWQVQLCLWTESSQEPCPTALGFLLPCSANGFSPLLPTLTPPGWLKSPAVP